MFSSLIPLKQGLKHISGNLHLIGSIWFSSLIPLKQGLKQSNFSWNNYGIVCLVPSFH